MDLVDIIKFSKYYEDYKIASKEWKQYFIDLLKEIPNIDPNTKNFLETRRMSSAKVLLPIILFDILSPDKKKKCVITNTMLYILFVRSTDDLIDEKYLNKNSVKVLEDFYNYVQTSSESIFIDYNDKKNLVTSVAYILKKSYEMIPENEKDRYIKFGEEIIKIEKLEFSDNKEDKARGRLEVCGLYTKGFYEIVSMHAGIKNEEVAQAMYYLGLASRFYDDASDKDYPKNGLSKKELIKLGNENMNLANNCIKANREKSIFQGLTSLLKVWWYIERNIKN